MAATPAQPPPVPAAPVLRGITPLYLLALAAIVFLAIAVVRVEYQILDRQDSADRIAVQAARHQLLASRIADLSLRLAITPSGPQRDAWSTSFETAIAELRDTHRRFLELTTGSGESVLSHSAGASYDSDPHRLDGPLDSFLSLARQVAASPPSPQNAPSANPSAASSGTTDPRLRSLDDFTYTQLPTGLEAIVNQYQSASTLSIRSARTLQSVLGVALLAVLLVEALFIYRPAFHQISRLQSRLIEAAQLDPITGTLNRLYINDVAAREFERCRRHGVGLAVLMIGVDRFKAVNDAYGYAAGDHALATLATCIKARARATDTVGRIGGAEFVLLLPATTLEEANLVAERLRHEVSSTPVQSGSLSFSITVSIGLTMIDKFDSASFDALARADRGMYTAKREGRDRVVIDRSRDPLSQASAPSTGSDSPRKDRRRPGIGL